MFLPKVPKTWQAVFSLPSSLRRQDGLISRGVNVFRRGEHRRTLCVHWRGVNGRSRIVALHASPLAQSQLHGHVGGEVSTAPRGDAAGSPWKRGRLGKGFLLLFLRHSGCILLSSDAADRSQPSTTDTLSVSFSRLEPHV